MLIPNRLTVIQTWLETEVNLVTEAIAYFKGGNGYSNFYNLYTLLLLSDKNELISNLNTTFTRDDMLDWFKNNLVASYISKASRAMPNTVSTWQETYATHTMESYFHHIEEEFGQSIYDLLVQKFLSVSKAYLDSFNLSEWHIYGSSREGIYKTSQTLVSLKYFADTSAYGLSNPQTVQVYYATMSYDFFYLERGKRQYELSNHLGNVLTVVSDKRILVCNADTLTTSLASIISATDYSPFGAPLAERTFSSEAYRFGFNGQEKDNEVAGAGNTMNAEFWEYDARLGRRWNLDPVVYNWQSGYVCFNNNPIFFYDYYGLEGENGNDRTTGQSETKREDESSLSYLNQQRTNKERDNSSWLKKLVDFITGNHKSPSGKWIKDNSRNWTELPSTFNSDNNSYSFSASSNSSDRIISYKIQISYPNSEENFSYFKLKALIPNKKQTTKTLYTGFHIPLSLGFSKQNWNYHSGLGDKVGNFGAVLLILSSYGQISLDPRISATIMMTGRLFGHRINPIYRDCSNFEVSINSNQTMAENDIKMFVRYKRYVPYLELTDQQKGRFKLWYHGY